MAVAVPVGNDLSVKRSVFKVLNSDFFSSLSLLYMRVLTKGTSMTNDISELPIISFCAYSLN